MERKDRSKPEGQDTDHRGSRPLPWMNRLKLHALSLTIAAFGAVLVVTEGCRLI